MTVRYGSVQQTTTSCFSTTGTRGQASVCASELEAHARLFGLFKGTTDSVGRSMKGDEEVGVVIARPVVRYNDREFPVQ